MSSENKFKDFNINFLANPFNSDLSLVKDEKSVIQALKNIILTDRGESPFNLDFGGDINSLLFELPSPTLNALLEDKIRLAISNFEPRIEVLNIKVVDDSSNNRYHVEIEFTTVLSSSTSNIKFFIDRTL